MTPGTTAIIGNVERRRDAEAKQSPMTLLKELPALVVLERFPVPVLAIAEDGTLLFANAAFADMPDHSVGDAEECRMASRATNSLK
jgi:hypothetical protein